MPEADALAWAGAVAGWAAPLTIGTFVVAGGRRRRSYDPWRDTMTELGDRTDATATMFVIVNLVVAALLGVLAWSIRGTLGTRSLTIAVIIAAVGSFVFGLTACRQGCRYPGRDGTSPGWLRSLHVIAALVVAVDIVVAPLLTWFALQHGGDDLTAIRVASLALGGAAAVLLAVFLHQFAAWRRADKAKQATGAIPGLFERLLWVVGYAWVVALACTLVRPGWPSVLAMGLWLALALRFVLRPGWRDPSPQFSLADCQPATLRAVTNATCGTFRVGTIRSACAFRADLGDALERGLVGGADKNATTAVTVAVTARGLHELGVAYRWRAPFVDDAFADGMLKRAAELGDTGPSDPTKWDEGWRHADNLHVAFWTQATTTDELDALDRRVTDHFRSVEQRVAEPTRRQGAPGTPQAREHFGFADGISQPWIDGVHTRSEPERRGGGKWTLRAGWKPLALGEFVIGQVDETGDIFPVPSPAEVFLGGTFLVVRKLEQDVAAFRRYAGSDDAESSLAAELIGRTRDGAALELRGAACPSSNDFTYGGDPEGLLCPLGAHIRRANPRDALGFASTLSVRRRIVRRGMPYGPGWDPADPEADRGLMFVACNVRIAEQFEFIQKQWMNDGSAFGLGNSPDPLGGNWPPHSRRPFIVQGRPPKVKDPLPAFVKTKGGEYFFVPSVPGLRALARPATPARRRSDEAIGRCGPRSN
jgi:Dyp-type peroxidase family